MQGLLLGLSRGVAVQRRSPPNRVTSERRRFAYFTLPEREGEGLASQPAAALVAIARAAASGVALLAKTEPRPNASTRILEKLGFRRDGATTDAEIGTAWVWRLD